MVLKFLGRKFHSIWDTKRKTSIGIQTNVRPAEITQVTDISEENGKR